MSKAGIIKLARMIESDAVAPPEVRIRAMRRVAHLSDEETKRIWIGPERSVSESVLALDKGLCIPPIQE
jgi:hypothetical protein